MRRRTRGHLGRLGDACRERCVPFSLGDACRLAPDPVCPELTAARFWTNRKDCPSHALQLSSAFSPGRPKVSALWWSHPTGCHMTAFRARRAVGFVLVLVGSVRANPCDTCSNCYDMDTNNCMAGETAASCVGSPGSYDKKWCGPNPCDSCSGCYVPSFLGSTEGICYKTTAEQGTCFSNGEGAMWCGVDKGTCVGCYGCYKQSDTGRPVCDTNSFGDGSGCTDYNHIDGVDNVWCPSTASQSWPCVDSASGETCHGCYNLNYDICDFPLSSGIQNCVGAHMRWCGPDQHDGNAGDDGRGRRQGDACVHGARAPQREHFQ